MSSSRHNNNNNNNNISDGRRPEKPDFVYTCNLLSQYIKEKGSLRDLNIEIGGKVENLETLVKPGSSQYASTSIPNNKRELVELTREQHPSDSSINTVEHSSCKRTSKEATATDSKTSQLTIFYSGRVMVFEDYPANKVKDLVSCAKRGSSQMSFGILSNAFRGLPPRPQACSSHKGVGNSSNTCKEITNTAVGGIIGTSTRSERQVSPQPEATGSDMLIARRSSLHRFLEKRKDRGDAGRGPHQVQEQPTSSSSKGDESLDLKL